MRLELINRISAVAVVGYFAAGCLPQQRAESYLSNMVAEKYFPDRSQLALARAIEAEEIPAIDRAVADGADVNRLGKDEMTPLAWAFTKQKKESFRRLLEKGANPNFKTKKAAWNNDGQSIMQFSAMASDPDYLRLSLKYGGNPNAPDLLPGKTIIYTAIRNRRPENIRILARSGANLNFQDASGATPAMMAKNDSQFDLVYLLMELGADMKVRQVFKDLEGRVHKGWTIGEQIQRTGDRSIKVLGKEKKQRDWYDKVVLELRRRGLM